MGENIQRRKGTLKFEGKTIKIYYPNPKRPDKQKQIQVRGISIPEKYDGEEVEYELEGGSKIHWVKIKSDGKMFERKQYGGSIPHNNFNKSQSFHNKREDSHPPRFLRPEHHGGLSEHKSRERRGTRDRTDLRY